VRVITSTANQQVKEIKHLRERKHREATGLAYVEGIRLVYEAVNQESFVEKVIVAPGLTKSAVVDDVLNRANARAVEIVEVSKEVFESISSKNGPQGLAAVVRQKWTALNTITGQGGLWLALFEVADPGNLGTILRSMDGAGGNGIVLIGNCTDPYDPTAVRASMGAIFSKRLVKASENEFIGWVKESGKTLIGTSDRSPITFRSISYNIDMVLLMGSERQGIPPTLEKECHTLVSIPMSGVCDSLNLAVAASILIYEINKSNLMKD